MNSRRFLSLFVILVILLITVVSAEEKETRSRTNHAHTKQKTLTKSTTTSLSKSTTLSSSKNIKKLEEDEEDDDEDEEKEEVKEEKGEDKPEEETEDKPEVKTTTTTSTTTTTTKTTTTRTSTTTTKTTTIKTTTTTTKSDVPTNTVVSSSIQNVNDAPISNAVAPESNPINNPIAPNSNSDVNSYVTPNASSNINTDNNVQKQEGSNSNNVVKISLISIVAVGAVVGVATIGVHAYNKKSGETRDINFGDIEAQPIIHDFGKSNNEVNTPIDEYNAYNVMNENNRLYLNNNPYEFKPNYDNFVTTPFEKVETDQNNVMNRESIFSNENNTQQGINDVYNFNNENQQLPYVQGLPVENGFIEKPVANEIEVENFDMRNSQMPTLVPVEPEIIITKPDEEQVNAQDGYKNIVPTVAKMEIIETPDFNKMTTSMIEEHINNMDLENLASINSESQIQAQQEQEAGYKEIVPDIQEAVIENFDIEDDQEQEFSAVDNITDTYRAALRATYCSTTDDNRFSIRTVDSDHSLLHTMREEQPNW